MEKFFYPRSVAVIGVSNSPHNLARNIVNNLMGFQFTGEIYCVGPGAGSSSGSAFTPTSSTSPRRLIWR